MCMYRNIADLHFYFLLWGEKYWDKHDRALMVLCELVAVNAQCSLLEKTYYMAAVVEATVVNPVRNSSQTCESYT